jgi:RES domain-containing protein
MRAWRIATDTPTYTSEDLSGAGAKATGGRWNSKGNAMLYCASSIALATLETVVHLSAGGLPLNRYLVQIDIPEAVWDKRQQLSAPSAPVGWDALPVGMVSIQVGDVWLASQASAVLGVPSIIVPEELNILINPLHSDSPMITAIKIRKWVYDSRLVSKGGRL